MPTTVTRRIEFDAGHRVLGHQGKCKHLHGHRYVVDVTVSAADLDSLGMVVDFGKIKELLGGWIDQNWDHNLLLNSGDPLCWCVDFHEAVERKPYLFTDENPTAEVIARHLFGIAGELLRSLPIRVVEVKVSETPNCWATYRKESTFEDKIV